MYYRELIIQNRNVKSAAFYAIYVSCTSSNCTYSNSTKFVLKRSDDCDYVIYAVPPMREIPCFMYHPGYPSGLVKVHGIPL